MTRISNRPLEFRSVRFKADIAFVVLMTASERMISEIKWFGKISETLDDTTRNLVFTGFVVLSFLFFGVAKFY